MLACTPRMPEGRRPKWACRVGAAYGGGSFCLANHWVERITNGLFVGLFHPAVLPSAAGASAGIIDLGVQDVARMRSGSWNGNIELLRQINEYADAAERAKPKLAAGRA